MNQEQVWREFAALPPQAQQQVADFIAFLSTRFTEASTRSPDSPTNLADEPFVGLWRDRDDLVDSRKWVREVREREWAKAHD